MNIINFNTEKSNCFSQLILDYFDNKFVSSHNVNNNFNEKISNNLWEIAEKNIAEGKTTAINQLKISFPQLNFPIDNEICDNEDYKKATTKGDFTEINFSENTLKLQNPHNISLSVYPSFTGHIPVLKIDNAIDFEKIIQALLHKNKPVTIPRSMGAALINGINNWDKIKKLQRNWANSNSIQNTWNEEFKYNILPYPHLYKDRIIIISNKPYSNVHSSELYLEQNDWLNLSETIRIEHECTHLYTLIKYGCASNNLHDEIIADYIGIKKTGNNYNIDWMLTFFGLENYPNYREGARLQNYIQNIEIDSPDFKDLLSIVRNAILNIKSFDKGIQQSSINIPLIIDTLCQTSVLDIASKDGAKMLHEKYYSLKNYQH